MSNFGSYHPGVLFLYYMMVLLFAMFSVQPVVLVCILAGGIFFFGMLKPLRELARNLAYYFFSVSAAGGGKSAVRPQR